MDVTRNLSHNILLAYDVGANHKILQKQPENFEESGIFVGSVVGLQQFCARVMREDRDQRAIFTRRPFAVRTFSPSR